MRVKFYTPLIIILFTCLSFNDDHEEEEGERFPFLEGNFSLEAIDIPDTVDFCEMEFYLVRDSDMMPVFYSAHIFTGVCENKVCNPVRINLFWDLFGYFLGFDVPAGYPLTKTGHKPFSPDDYYLLYKILNNPYSKLGKFEKQELVKIPVSMTGVDATSGATIITDNTSVVKDAAFTTYTLWHIVYSPLILDLIRPRGDTLTSSLINGPVSMKQCKNLIENLPLLSNYELNLLLVKAYGEKLLRRQSVQNLLTDKINETNEYKAVLINNYLSREAFIYPEAEDKLKKNTITGPVFKKMTPAGP